MYVWIDAEKWAADGQPALSEAHGTLFGPSAELGPYEVPEWYGTVLGAEQEEVIVKALVEWRFQAALPFDDV